LTVRDWVVAAAATVAMSVRVTTGGDVPVSRAGDAATFALTVLAGLALVRRRHRPGIAVTAAVVASVGHSLIAGPVVPVAGWLAIAVAARHVPALKPALRAAAAAAACVVAGSAAGAAVHGRTAALPLVVSLTVVVLLAAALVRLQAARVEAQAREREAERGRAAADERLRIARDLHDLVGHGLSAIAVQSGTARLALRAGDADAAARAMAAVEEASRGALAEMRQLLGVLRQADAGSDRAATDGAARDGAARDGAARDGAARDGAARDGAARDRAARDGASTELAGTEPAPGLDRIEALADAARAAGHRVTVHRAGPLDAVPAPTGLAAYRVVQEATTNAIRHAAGAPIAISLRAGEGVLVVEVTDEGGTPDADSGADDSGDDRPRYGLTGLRERVAAAGGDLSAGPRADGAGWRVAARLPLPAPSPTTSLAATESEDAAAPEEERP
jgi:signal transduction histidine kinase